MKWPGTVLGRSSRGWQDAIFVVLMLVYTLQFAEQVLMPNGGTEHEELNAAVSAGLLLAGHPWNLAQLQYVDVCGGCTFETLLILPGFALFGPSLAVWKLIPYTAGALVLLLSWAIGREIAGRWGAVVAGAVVTFAPSYFRACGAIAFGSHYEVQVLILLAVLLWARLITRGGAALAFGLGLTLGAAHWFAHIADFAAPVLLALWLIPSLRRRGLRTTFVECAAVAAGAALGLVPWVVTMSALNVSIAQMSSLSGNTDTGWSQALALRISALSPARYGQGLYYGVFARGGASIGYIYYAAQVATLGWALGAGLWGTRKEHSHQSPPWALLSALLVLAYLALFLAAAPLQAFGGDDLFGNSMRYFVPLVPLLALGLAATAGKVLQRNQEGFARRVAIALLGLVLGPGAIGLVLEADFARYSPRIFWISAIGQADELRGQLVIDWDPDGEAWLARLDGPDGLRQTPRVRHARWIYLRSWGRWRSETIARSGDWTGVGRDLAWLRALDPADRQAIADGFANGFGPPFFPDPWGDPEMVPSPESSRLRALVDDADLEAEFWYCRLLRRPATLWSTEESIRRGVPEPAGSWLLSNPDAPPARGLVRALAQSYGGGNQLERELRIEWEKALEFMTLLPPALHKDFLAGLGEGMGSDWAHRPELPAELWSDLSPDDQAILAESFDLGAEAWNLYVPRGPQP